MPREKDAIRSDERQTAIELVELDGTNLRTCATIDRDEGVDSSSSSYRAMVLRHDVSIQLFDEASSFEVYPTTLSPMSAKASRKARIESQE